MITTAEFYDALAPEYDRMIDAEQRFVKAQEQFRQVVAKQNIRTALDAGCGTGFHSVLLASAGVEVTAVDLSYEMLRRLRQHSEKLQLKITTIQCGFELLLEHIQTKFDAVFCLGNTLPHLLDDDTLLHSLSNFKHVLQRDGTLILQILNYDRILNTRDRIQNIKEREGKTYIRFYDFLEKTIAFNILTIQRKDQTIEHSLQTTELRPWRSAELVRLLHEAGFTDIKQYGTMSQIPYEEHSSNDLVIFAKY